MKKGILTTLLLASGAALAVYLLKEEQERKNEADNDEIRMIKLRSEEEDKELVRTIQEIENLPFRDIKEDSFKDVENSDIDIPTFKAIPENETQVESKPENFEAKENLEDLLENFDVPSINSEFNKYETFNEEEFDQLEEAVEVVEEFNVPKFVEKEIPTTSEEIQLKTLMHPFGDPLVKAEEITIPRENNELNSNTFDIDTDLGMTDTLEIPVMVQEVKTKTEDEDLSKTAIFDLPKMFSSDNATDSTKIQTNRNPFEDDGLEEFDLTELFNDLDDANEVDPTMFMKDSLEETSELKLVDLDEDEIRKLFTIDSEDDLEEIKLDVHQEENLPLKKELSQDEFEDFKKRLVHIDEDDVDLINFNDSKPFETVENQAPVEIDIINFGNIVEEPTVALEDLVLDKPLELDINKNIAPEEVTLEDVALPDLSQHNQQEYPSAVMDISKLYPYLNLKFIKAVFDNFGAFNAEFEVGSTCRITHRVQFPESQNLISFIEIIKEYGYEIEGTDDEHNILVHLDFENQESKILSEIYNISNQVNFLDGLYKGYELEHI